MTGKDLILYILQNDLEDIDLFDGDIYSLFLTVERAAVKMKVGVETVKLWSDIGLIDGIHIGGEVYFRNDIEIPTSFDISGKRRRNT